MDAVSSLRTCNGRVFFLNAADVPQHLHQLFPEQQATLRAGAFEVDIIPDSSSRRLPPWPTHTSNSSRLFNPSPSPQGLPAPFYLLRNEQGLPMPPPDYVPPVQTPQAGKSDFGHWDFFSAEDREEAQAHGFYHPSMLVYAAHCGMQGLSASKLIWIPGWIEGSQGSRIGPANAYVHIWMINERRRFWSGLQPMWPGELPTYIGTDAWWPARKGANASELDRLRASDSYQDVLSLCEENIIKKLESRQGHDARLAYELAASTPVHRSLPDRLTADAWNVRLQMSNPRMELGGPLVVRNLTAPNRPRDKRTSFHQASVHSGHRKDMLAINYVIKKPDCLPVPDFVKRTKGVADVMVMPYPRLNPDGEQIWTMIKPDEKHGFQQMRQPDLPFMPETVDVNEDVAVLEAWLRAGANWPEIISSMDEDERQYQSYCATQLSRVRSALQLEVWRDDDKTTGAQGKPVLKPWTPAEVAGNPGRGKVPGLISPTYPRTAVNWVPYTSKGYSDPSETREANLKQQSTMYQRKCADDRNAMEAAQNAQAPLVTVSGVRADPRGVRRAAEEDEPHKPAKRSRKASAASNAATAVADTADGLEMLVPRVPDGISSDIFDMSPIGHLAPDADQITPGVHSYEQIATGHGHRIETQGQSLQLSSCPHDRRLASQRPGHLLGGEPLPMINDEQQQHGGLNHGASSSWFPDSYVSRVDNRPFAPVKAQAPSIDPNFTNAAHPNNMLRSSPGPHGPQQTSAAVSSPDASTTLLSELERALGPLS